MPTPPDPDAVSAWLFAGVAGWIVAAWIVVAVLLGPLIAKGINRFGNPTTDTDDESGEGGHVTPPEDYAARTLRAIEDAADRGETR